MIVNLNFYAIDLFRCLVTLQNESQQGRDVWVRHCGEGFAARLLGILVPKSEAVEGRAWI